MVSNVVKSGKIFLQSSNKYYYSNSVFLHFTHFSSKMNLPSSSSLKPISDLGAYIFFDLARALSALRNNNSVLVSSSNLSAASPGS